MVLKTNKLVVGGGETTMMTYSGFERGSLRVGLGARARSLLVDWALCWGSSCCKMVVMVNFERIAYTM